MSKIIIVCVSLYRGGAERVISVLSQEFLKTYDSVEIVTWRKKDVSYAIDSRIKVTSLTEGPATIPKFLRAIPAFRKYVKKEAPDFVLSFLTESDLLVISSLLFTKIPIFVSVRNDPKISPKNRFLRIARNWLYQYTIGIVFQTNANKNTLRAGLRAKGVVISNPTFISQEKVGCALDTEKKKKIVTVGRLADQKNQAMSIRLMKAINSIYPDYTLHIYGEGPNRLQLERMINAENLADIVLLQGNVDDIVSHISDATIFLLTSNYEGMPNALIEAMCLGLPVISTKVSGTEELVSDGENGYLIDINNQDQLNERVLQLLSDETLRNRLAKNATMIYPKLTIQNITSQWIDFFNLQLHKKQEAN